MAGIVPVDLQTAQTGKRVYMGNAARCDIVIFKAVGTAAQDQAWNVQQHNAASAGTSKDLDIVDHYYLKDELTLDGDETWSKITQTAASEIPDAGGAGTSAEHEQIVVIPIDAAQLDMANGFKWLSIDNDGAGANAQLGGVLYILHGLRYPNAPTLLPSTQ